MFGWFKKYVEEKSKFKIYVRKNYYTYHILYKKEGFFQKFKEITEPTYNYTYIDDISTEIPKPVKPYCGAMYLFDEDVAISLSKNFNSYSDIELWNKTQDKIYQDYLVRYENDLNEYNGKKNNGTFSVIIERHSTHSDINKFDYYIILYKKDTSYNYRRLTQSFYMLNHSGKPDLPKRNFPVLNYRDDWIKVENENHEVNEFKYHIDLKKYSDYLKNIKKEHIQGLSKEEKRDRVIIK